jgi:Family of unknown function (DUF6527)
MTRYRQLEHRFVDDIPEPLDGGVLYVSIRYATAVHLCCCGCGREVVTPLSPAQWRVTFDGETASLHPSIGNWNLACRSHYVIRNGRVFEAGQWSDEEVAFGQARDKRARATLYASEAGAIAEIESTKAPVARRGRHWLGSIGDFFTARRER